MSDDKQQEARAPERASNDATAAPVVVTVPANQAGTGPVVYRFAITAALPK